MSEMLGRKEQTVFATSVGSRSMKLESSARRSVSIRGFVIADMLVISISLAWAECLSLVRAIHKTSDIRAGAISRD